MSDFKTKICQVEACKISYQPTGRCSKYCPECSVIKKRERAKLNQRHYRELAGKPFGVGKGGANAIGPNDSQYTSGIKIFQKARRLIKIVIQFCERCGLDLEDAKAGYWCVHHKDHDRTNNVPENWELLCKKCHQLEHECWKNLPN